MLGYAHRWSWPRQSVNWKDQVSSLVVDCRMRMLDDSFVLGICPAFVMACRCSVARGKGSGGWFNTTTTDDVTFSLTNDSSFIEISIAQTTSTHQIQQKSDEGTSQLASYIFLGRVDWRRVARKVAHTTRLHAKDGTDLAPDTKLSVKFPEIDGSSAS